MAVTVLTIADRPDRCHFSDAYCANTLRYTGVTIAKPLQTDNFDDGLTL